MPAISLQPTTQSVTAGQTATFTAAASGNPMPTVQWQVSTDGGSIWSDISGATSTTLILNNVTTDMNGNEYQAVFTNSIGTATTSAATLTVNATRTAPSITTQPSNQTVSAGQTATFMAAASGNPAPTAQWQVSSDGGSSWSNLSDSSTVSGSATGTLTLSNVTIGMSSNEYRAVFSNGVGSPATSNAATLTVNTAGTAPTITSGNSIVLAVGQGGSFLVTATGSPTPTVTESGALPRGVTFTDNGNGTASLGVAPSTASGTYHFTITAHNGVGTDATQQLTLTVNQLPPPPPPPPAPPLPPPPPALQTPPLLAFFDALLGGTETVNGNGTETVVDSFFGFPLLVSTYDSSGHLMSATLFGFNITFLFG